MITILSFNIRSQTWSSLELWSSFQLFYALLPAQWRTPTTAISSQRSVLKAVTLSSTLSTSTSGSVEQTSPFPSARCCKVCAFFFFSWALPPIVCTVNCTTSSHCVHCYSIVCFAELQCMQTSQASQCTCHPSSSLPPFCSVCSSIYTILLRKPSFLYPRRHFSLEGWSSCSNWASQRHRQHAPGRNRRQLR